MSTPTGKTFTPGRYNDVANFYAAMNLADFVFQNTTTPWDWAQTDDLYYRGIMPAGADCHRNFNDNVTEQTGNGNNATPTGGMYSTDVPLKLRTTV